MFVLNNYRNKKKIHDRFFRVKIQHTDRPKKQNQCRPFFLLFKLRCDSRKQKS